MHAEFSQKEPMHRPGTSFSLEVNPRIPPELARLEELANNLWFSWHRSTRELFTRLDPQLWNAVGHSPKALLKSGEKMISTGYGALIFAAVCMLFGRSLLHAHAGLSHDGV